MEADLDNATEELQRLLRLQELKIILHISVLAYVTIRGKSSARYCEATTSEELYLVTSDVLKAVKIGYWTGSMHGLYKRYQIRFLSVSAFMYSMTFRGIGKLDKFCESAQEASIAAGVSGIALLPCWPL